MILLRGGGRSHLHDDKSKSITGWRNAITAGCRIL